MSGPLRIQRRRAKGWRMPPGAVSVCRPGKWGNLWHVGLARCGCRSAGECGHNSFRTETAAEAVAAYRDWIEQAFAHPSGRHTRAALDAEIRGKNLACWCRLCERHRDGKPLGIDCPDCPPCHADVLLELANAVRPDEGNAEP